MVDEVGVSEEDIKRYILQILQTLDNESRKMSGGPSPEMSNGTQVVSALMVGCVRLSRGIQLLIHRDLPEEALILARTLVEDSTLLAYLHKHADRLEDFALAIYMESLNEDEALEREATSLRMRSPEIRLPRIMRDKETVQQLKVKRGLKKLPGLPSLKTMLRELDAQPVYWWFKKSSQMVHSTTGLASRLEWDEDEGTVTVRMEGDVNSMLVVGWITTESIMTALIAGGLLLKWDSQEVVKVRPQTRAIYRRFLEIQGLRTGAFEELHNLPPKVED